jgi:hypothetical protein
MLLSRDHIPTWHPNSEKTVISGAKTLWITLSWFESMRGSQLRLSDLQRIG